MQSGVFVTHQIDDPEVAVEELATAAESLKLLANSAGILFCYSDTELDEIVPALQNRLPFDIVGCTTIASMDGRDGFHPLAATLLVLTADDCEFTVAASEPITPENVLTRIEETYRAAAGEKEPGLVFAVPPYRLEIMLDAYTETFNKIAPNVPFVGGLPSNIGNGDKTLTHCRGEIYTDRLILVAISGNVHPVMSVQTSPGVQQERKSKVTKAKDNIVYRVGDQNFLDFMEQRGIPVGSLAEGNTAITFVSMPLLLEHTHVGVAGDISFLRTLHEVNLEDRSGIAIGKIPEGATISVCPMSRDGIIEGASMGVAALKEKMAEAGDYTFSTVLMVSCVGRHLIMSPNSSVEVDQLLKDMPEELSFGGFYCYGEIGPVSGNDPATTFAHNESLVLCAF